MTTNNGFYKCNDFNNVNCGIVRIPHRTIDEHAHHMGYPAGSLSGFHWGVYDHYGIHAREQKKGTHLLDRNYK